MPRSPELDLHRLLQRDPAAISKKGGLCQREVRIIFQAIREGGPLGKQARDFLLLANHRLVYAIALRYRHRSPAFDLDDLVQEGQIGLIRAIESFDPQKGFRFSTYAVWWIRQAMTRALADQANLIRIPAYLSQALAKTTGHLQETLGRAPTLAELAAAALVSEARVREFWHATNPISLDQPCNTNEDLITFEDVLSTDEEAPLELAMQQMRRNELAQALCTLSPRLQRVIQLRYGLADGQPLTLEEVGQALGVTKERVRQLEHKALDQLRQVPQLAALQEA